MSIYLAGPVVAYGIAKPQLPVFFERSPAGYAARIARGSVSVSPGRFQLADGDNAGTLGFRWRGSTPTPLLAGEPTGGVSNYLAGEDPSHWRLAVPHMARVTERRLYPGIDIVYYSNGPSLEFDLVVHPGANPNRVRLAVDSPHRMEMDDDGVLVRTARGGYRYRRPRAYQILDGVQKPVECAFAIDGKGEVRFRVGAYDHSRQLVIDPVVQYMTYLGGAGIDHIQAVGVDTAGNSILAGITSSANFPGAGALASGSISIFVTRLNASGSAVQFTTILGSRSNANAAFPSEAVSSLTTDADGNIYLAGVSYAANFPTSSGAWQRASSGGFVTKLDSSGNVVYSTFLGPSVWGLQAQSIKARNGTAYLAGTASRPEFFGTAGALQRGLKGNENFFVAALPADGSLPFFVTALGGTGQDYLTDMALDGDGNILLVGTTTSTDFPRTRDALSYPAPADNRTTGVLARIDPAGARLLYSTYLGTDSVNGVTLLPNGDFVISGGSPLSPDLIAAAPHYSIRFSSNSSGASAYVARFSPANRLLWSTDFQTTIGSFGHGIIADQQSNLYWVNNCQAAGGGYLSGGGYYGLFKLSPDGSRLLYCSPLPAALPPAVATDGSGQVLFGGWTGSSAAPVTPGVVQPQRDPGTAGTSQNPLNADDGVAGVLDLRSFTDGNFYATSPQPLLATWRIGEPLPPPLSLSVVLSGDPGPITVAASARITAAYSTSPAPSVSINANPAQTVAGQFTETVTLRSGNPNASLLVPIQVSVLPQVNFTLASNQVQVHLRKGQDRSTVTLPSVAITTDFGGGYFSFDVASSDRSWLYGSVDSVDVGHIKLSIGVVDIAPGTYDGTLTLRLSGIQNLQKTVQVHYILDPPATIEVSSTIVRLHVVKGQPIQPATLAVTSSTPGVSWSIFVGVSRTWLQVTQTTRATPGEVRVTVDPASVEMGYWSFLMLVDGEAGQQIRTTIVVDVSSVAPLDIVPDTIDVQFTRGAQAYQTTPVVTFVAPVPTAVQWSADQPWVINRQGTGTTPFLIGLAFDATLAEGVYHATLTARAGATVKTIPLTWRLYDSPYLVFPTTPIHLTYRIGGPPPATQQIKITCPTLNPGYFQAYAPYGTFLQTDPQYGFTPATVTLTASVQGLAAGTYQTNLTIGSAYPDRTTYPLIPVTLDVLPDLNAPTAALSKLVDAASFLPGAVSPGEILTIFGTAMGPATLIQSQPGANGRFPSTLSATTFYFDEIAAPVLYLSAAQAAVVAPFGIAGRTKTSVTVETGGRRSLPLTAAVADSSPGVFTANSSGTGLAAAQNDAADGSITVHSASNPAVRGGVVTLYVTGLGATMPPLPDGGLSGIPLAKLAANVKVLVGGLPAEILYAGPAPGLIAGLMQINIRVPDSVGSGQLPLLIVAGDNPSQLGVTLAVQ